MNNGIDHDEFEADEPTIPDRGSTDAVFIRTAAKRLRECCEAFETIGAQFDELDEAEQLRVWDGIRTQARALGENAHDLSRYAGAKVKRVQSVLDGK